MPRRSDLQRVVVIGSGPIVIGQACEFDYSGAQGLKALAADGIEAIVVNSNPATIMTDPGFAMRTYIEPLDARTVARVLERERPQAVLPTLGGQTALNIALQLHDDGTLEKLGVELIGARAESIRKAEDRDRFRRAMHAIGLSCPRADYVGSVAEARRFADGNGYPVVVRASFRLGGGGSGVVRTRAELDAKVEAALAFSPDGRVLVEESVVGWKEFELEVIRDTAGNFIVVCAIENIDPMGVHTGDSITVAPCMTLTDREYQRLRDAARAVMDEVGVTTGGANVQFAVHPRTGEFHVIEMNPRVSRSSALASKATGYPIAKIATKLAIGYRLDELTNDITRTSAAMEPVLDYVVVKWPRFAFDRFPGADARLGTQMKSVGEVMAIGRTFAEAIQKAASGLEIGADGVVRTFSDDELLDAARAVADGPLDDDSIASALRVLVATPTSDRLFHVVEALRRRALSVGEIAERSFIDPWFLEQLDALVRAPESFALDRASLARAKKLGFSDAAIARALGSSERDVAEARRAVGVEPRFARVDTCAAELDSHTPYLYSHFEAESEAAPSDRRKVIILGAGPNRIGQGLEFDYCCVHAAFALKKLGVETVMVNCNPETVSTDYDVADRLYFEPLTLERVLAVYDEERSRGHVEGIIVQMGGQTPLRLTAALAKRGVPILGTPAASIDRAEERERFDELLAELSIPRARGGFATTLDGAIGAARALGFPVLVRPSYVLGGQAMAVCHDEADLVQYARHALSQTGNQGALLIDQFLEDAIEVDVDCLSDGRDVYIAGMLEHIERAGVHSGDSAAVLPPFSLAPSALETMREYAVKLARALGVVGLMNMQFAVARDKVYVLEVNPRASRTVPFIAKASGVPLAMLATELMLGRTIAELDLPRAAHPFTAVKESVFPFDRLAGADPALGPQMRSTGEVMGVARSMAVAFAKATRAAGYVLPREGRALVALAPRDERAAVSLARRLCALGFAVEATEPTASSLAREQIINVARSTEDAVRSIRTGGIQAVFVTADASDEVRATGDIRRQAVAHAIPYFTTLNAGMAALEALEAIASPGGDDGEVRSIQEWYRQGPLS